MSHFGHDGILVFFLSVGVLLVAARAAGEMAIRLRQPAVIGELLAGILLGPTCLGTLAPGLHAYLFPATGPLPVAIEGLTTLAIMLFLLVAGMEVDLSTIWRQGTTALTVGTTGMLFPFAIGFVLSYFAPGLLFGESPADRRLVLSLFFATALSISALPVIVKILRDLNIFRSDLGMLVVAAAILNDVLGWTVFALVLGMSGAAAGAMSFGATLALTLGFTLTMLTAGRWLIGRLLLFIQAHARAPGSVLGFAMSGAIFCGAFTEWIGLHAIFGAFLFGVALGDSHHLRERTRATLEQFISFIFAPLFFATIGLRVNFAANFDPILVTLVLVIATIGKVGGCWLGARWSGLNVRESLAVGFGMNARGAMEIILGLLALNAGIINERLFVALVVMALVTSMTSGTCMQVILRKKKHVRFTQFLSARSFVGRLQAADRRGAIEELCRALAGPAGLDAATLTQAVWAREELVSTSLGQGLAVPHARVAGLSAAYVAVGLAPQGISFDSPDGAPTRLIFLIVTPLDSYEMQAQILADIARTFLQAEMLEHVLAAKSHTEFLALLRSE